MKILLVNDDGVHAAGINTLFEALEAVENLEVLMVAPMEEKSTTGHSLSLAHPLRLVEISQSKFGVHGFPADCTLMGMGAVFKERPDLIISGINRGGNLGQDVFYSGTVAAAREGAFHGIPSISVSLVMEFEHRPILEEDYWVSAQIIKEIVQQKWHQYLPPKSLFNINVPLLPRNQIKGIKKTVLGFRKYSSHVQKLLDPRSKEYYWIVGKYEGFEPFIDSDCFAINEKYVSISTLSVLSTHHQQNNQDENCHQLNMLIDQFSRDYFH